MSGHETIYGTPLLCWSNHKRIVAKLWIVNRRKRMFMGRYGIHGASVGAWRIGGLMKAS